MSLMKLQKEVKHSMKAAFAEGTTKNVEAQWRAYLLFCEFYRLKALPTTSDIFVPLCTVFMSVLQIGGVCEELHFRRQNHALLFRCRVSCTTTGALETIIQRSG